jgi:hypothetical protein
VIALVLVHASNDSAVFKHLIVPRRLANIDPASGPKQFDQILMNPAINVTQLGRIRLAISHPQLSEPKGKSRPRTGSVWAGSQVPLQEIKDQILVLEVVAIVLTHGWPIQ